METMKIVSSRLQLTMTGVAGAEEIEDGLAAPRRPPPKHPTSLARVACVALPDVFSITVGERVVVVYPV